jgi:hypothetical protein
MKRWFIRTTILAAALMFGCGGSSSSNGTDPGTDTVIDTETAPDDGTPDILQDIQPPDISPDEGSPDMGGVDSIEDVPSGPFYPVEEGDKLTVSNGVVTLAYDLVRGTFDLGVVPGRDGIINGRSEAFLTVQGLDTVIASSDPGPRIQYQVINAPDELGEAVIIRFDAVPTNKIGGVATFISLHRETPAVTFRTIVAMPFSQDVTVSEIRPVVVDFAGNSTLHLGPGTPDAVLVDNGSELVLDFKADAQMVGENPGGMVGAGLASNWSAAVCTAAKSCVVAGFVTTHRAVGLVSTDQVPGKAVMIDGVEGLSLFSIRNRFAPVAGLDAGRTLSSDVAYVDISMDSHQSLLRFGRAIATFNGKPPPAAPPSSWNSWGGGFGSGGAGQGIDETFILQNLEAATRDFLPYGMDYFLLDDGWQKDDGAWTTDPVRFPMHGGEDGLAWMAKQIVAAGFLPGIWTAPFRVHKDWPITTAHPDWLLELDEFGSVALGANSDYRALDPSNDEVKAYLREIYGRITKDWGFRFIKLDFSVYSMFGTNYKTQGKSGLALYKDALEVIRETIGPETFLMVVSGTGVNYGIADGMRLTLDNMPRWGVTSSPFDQGIKATVLSASHRYWMGNTVWSNHPDLLFFRDTQGLASNEARAFGLWASLFGGFVKLGESFTFMESHPEALELVQRMIPPLPLMPEPLDLFQKRWPELWRVPLHALGGMYYVYGLFHWGENRDIPAQQDMDESDRTLRIPSIPDTSSGTAGPSPVRAMLDLIDGALLVDADDKAIRAGDVDVTMTARSGRLILARDVTDLDTAPVFLGTDRHLMGGAGVLEEASATTDGIRSIAFTKAVPGRITRLFFLVQRGASLDIKTTDASDVSQATTVHADADLVTVTLKTTAATTAVTASYITK